jgi:hypothetical protein
MSEVTPASIDLPRHGAVRLSGRIRHIGDPRRARDDGALRRSPFLSAPARSRCGAPGLTAGHLPRRFWVYVAAAALIAAGYADFPLIAFHFGKTGLIAPVWIPVLYSLAMAAEAMAALLLGRLFDKIGIGAMILATCASALSAPLAFLGGPAYPCRGGASGARHRQACRRSQRGFARHWGDRPFGVVRANGREPRGSHHATRPVSGAYHEVTWGLRQRRRLLLFPATFVNLAFGAKRIEGDGASFARHFSEIFFRAAIDAGREIDARTASFGGDNYEHGRKN